MEGLSLLDHTVPYAAITLTILYNLINLSRSNLKAATLSFFPSLQLSLKESYAKNSFFLSQKSFNFHKMALTDC